MIMSPQFKLHAQESPSSEGTFVSEVIEHIAPKGVQHTSNLRQVHFSQKSSNTPSGMKYPEGDKKKNRINMAPTGLT